jgi:hypothetical protein
MIQTLFSNNDAVFNDNTPIHIAGTVQSWLEEREGELQHHLNIIEPLWSVLETIVRNRFPLPVSLE